MIQLKNPRLLIFIIIGAVAIAVAFIYFVQFNIPEEHVPPPKRFQAPPSPVESITPPTTPPPGVSQPPQKPASTEVTKITIQGNEFSFAPQNISMKRGAKVELTFENIGRAPHNFTVNELNLATKTIGGGQSDTLTFTVPSTAGTITYASYCSVPGHREAGMEGTIVIE